MTMPKLTAQEIEERFNREFPQSHVGNGKPYTIESIGPRFARLRLRADAAALRPGGTVSGPTLMGLADLTVYVAILASIGWVPLAVTTSLTINFLRKPPPGDIVAECRLIKLGRRLAVGDVAIRAEGAEELVAHSVATYSIPPQAA